MIRLVSVFILSFTFNFVWEHVHAPLYLAYKGGAITSAILLHASFADACIITVCAAAYMYVPLLRTRLWLILAALLAVAVGTEWWALATGRWAYGPHMPLVPLLYTGLTPTVQLALLGYVTIKIISWPSTKSRCLQGL